LRIYAASQRGPLTRFPSCLYTPLHLVASFCLSVFEVWFEVWASRLDDWIVAAWAGCRSRAVKPRTRLRKKRGAREPKACSVACRPAHLSVSKGCVPDPPCAHLRGLEWSRAVASCLDFLAPPCHRSAQQRERLGVRAHFGDLDQLTLVELVFLYPAFPFGSHKLSSAGAAGGGRRWFDKCLPQAPPPVAPSRLGTAPHWELVHAPRARARASIYTR
jgi:hypothetical protein